MPNNIIHVELIWRNGTKFGISKALAELLARDLPKICSVALFVPGGTRYDKSDVMVEVRKQDRFCTNLYPVMIRVTAKGLSSQNLKRSFIVKTIADDVSARLGSAGKVLVSLTIAQRNQVAFAEG